MRNDAMVLALALCTAQAAMAADDCADTNGAGAGGCLVEARATVKAVAAPADATSAPRPDVPARDKAQAAEAEPDCY